MAPQTKVEFHILRLRFLPVIPPEYPKIKSKYRTDPPSESLNQVQDWFDNAMSKEISRIPSSLSVSYCEWRITSDDVKLFTINRCRFDKITVLLGEEDIHWVFYQRNPQAVRFLGCSPLTVNYCACCLDSQYKRIIESIKIDINRDCT